jgi:hypothetical protein
MRKFLVLVALLFSAPAFAQDKERPIELSRYEQIFPSQPGVEMSESEKRIAEAYNRFIDASDEAAKARAANRKNREQEVVVQVIMPRVINVRIENGVYMGRCPYNNCR